MKEIINLNDDTFLIKLVENTITLAHAKVSKNIIENLEVNKKFRNISFGKKTLTYVIEEVSNRGYDEVIVNTHNKATLNFFLKHSFKLENSKLILHGLKKERDEKKQLVNCSIVSLIVNISLAILKVTLGSIFSLNAVIADGINSATDSVTTILAIAGLKISAQTEDEEHPFGHGKIEVIFNLFIGFLIFLTTGSVFLDTLSKIFYYKELNISLDKNSLIIYSMTALFIVFKILQYMYVAIYAKKYKNNVLSALSKDYLIDILFSTVVLVGVILTIKFSYIYDILLSILILSFILYQAYTMIKESILILLETQDKDLIEEVKFIILENPEIFYVHDLFMVKSGKYIYMYGDVRIDKDYTVEKSHKIVEAINIKVRNKFENIKLLTLHVEPIYLN